MTISVAQQRIDSYASQLRIKEDQLTTAGIKISILERDCSAMVKQLDQQALGARPDIAPVSTTHLEELIAVLEGEIKSFDVATRQWQHLVVLRKSIKVNQSTSATVIAPSKIFVCGGGDEPCNHHADKRAYVLKGDGSVHELHPMSAARKAPGLAWDSERKALYVFGGWAGGGTCYTALRTSEMYLSGWSLLPDMHKARSAFNPCWHSSLLFLCGGRDINSVETYHPRFNCFTLQDFTLPENGQTTAVVECGLLTVISRNHISKLQQEKFTSQIHEEYYPWSNCTPVVSGGMVYIVNMPSCRCIDLTTGEVKAVNII